MCCPVPDTKEATITIDTKKRVTVLGVRSEIDVYVSVKLGNGLELIYIFECKNREEPVDKNDITVFDDKIQEVGAQKGYFVAKKYGIDAINKAKRYQRIELLKATDEFETLPFVADYHQINHMPPHVDLSFVIKTDNPQKVGIPIPFTAESKIRLLHEELLASKYGELIQQSVINEVMSHEPTGSFSAGAYSYDRTVKFTFRPKEVFIDGHECLALTARVSWEICLIRPRIISKFDIKTRGRVIKFESTEFPSGGNIQVSFIGIE